MFTPHFSNILGSTASMIPSTTAACFVEAELCGLFVQFQKLLKSLLGKLFAEARVRIWAYFVYSNA